MSDYTDIIDYYSLLAMQNPGKCVYHAPMKPLSPAAQTVLDACRDADVTDAASIAAVLRAAVTLVSTDEKLTRLGAEANYAIGYALYPLLSIAEELESL